ncbi:MAG: GEVED domain-containing protein, partial [Bacteroidales bacterium]
TLVNMGETYQLTVTNGNVYSADDLGVWIDWNQDQDFDDSGENVVCEADNGGEGTFDITIPNTAMAGETRMRIRMKWSGSDCGDPCGSTSYGEVEDYSIYVLGWLMLDPLSGSVMPGETDNIDVMFNAADLTEGTYTANLNVSSNDPDSPVLVIPVTLNVGDDLPMLDAFADPAEICEGGSTQLFANATGGSGGFDYIWTSDPPGFNSTEQNPMASPTETTAYICEVNDGSFSVFDTAMVYVTMMPGTSATPAGEEMLCQDAPNTTYETAGAADATSYMWMISPEDAGTVSGEGTIGIVDWDAAFSGEATITVKGINDCGEGDVSDGLVVMIDPLPAVSAIPTGEILLCEGIDKSEYETLGAASALTYKWIISPEEAGTIEGDGTLGTVTWDPAFIGEAYISVLGMNDCGDGVVSEELMVSVSMLPDVTFEMAQDSACVYNPAFTLTGGNPAGGVYSGAGVSNGEFDPAVAGNGEHTITYTFMENGCENMAEDVIYVGECLGINEFVDGIAISIYPNPNSGMFTMTLDSDVARSLNMKVLNNKGAVVYSEENIDGNKKFSRKMDLTGYGRNLFHSYLLGETQYLKKIIIE